MSSFIGKFSDMNKLSLGPKVKTLGLVRHFGLLNFWKKKAGC